MDKTNKKSNKEYLINQGDNKENPESCLAGLNDKFPIENFVELKSRQNGKEIILQTYKYPSAKEKPKGVIYLIHGLYEHSNSNAIIARFFSNHGYDVLSFDLRGHGKSEGIKGFLENQKVILEDINNFISITENEYNNETSINKFIIGYSLGGLMANLICLEKTNYFNGMILIAPAFHGEAEKKYSFWVKFARVLNKVAPSLSLLKIKEQPTDKAIIDYINKDPLIYKGKLRVGTGLTIVDSINYSNTRLDKVSTPVYLLQGQQDNICKSIGATNFFDNIPMKDKAIVLSDDMDHFIVRNPKIEFFLSDINVWMLYHSK